MAIRCPYCEHQMELTGIKPGRFQPRCTNCQEKFELVISAEASVPPKVKRIAAVNPTVAAIPPRPVTATGKPDHDSRAQATQAAPAQPVDRAQFFTQVKPQLQYDDLHGRLGGYDLIQRLGQGGMGSVYLARQVSLDRNIAVKTLSPTLAQDPQFVARFTREAYAAAQLSHHNVVQIHDIGHDKGTNFFSMELVDGTNLASVVEREGRLDPITAVMYTLQAARGLKFAHDHGLIHRDVKPENLLLNKEGVVKVADLGLVKRAGAVDITQAGPANAAAGATQLNASMGTPAYMSPEQVRDAGKVDHRADIYSLGCTLYDLVTGRPPFSGRTAVEVMTKHQKEPIVPPDKIVTNLPRRLSEIIQKMTAKTVESRYASMSEIVKDLEDFLGLEHGSGGGYAGVRGSQDQISIVTMAVEKFNSAGFASLRRNLILAFFVVALLSFVIGCATFTGWLVGGSLAFALLTPLAYQLTVGLRQKTTLFIRARQWLFSLKVSDYLTAIGAIVIALLLLYILGQLGLWVGIALAAIVLGIAFHFGVDNVVAAEREGPLQDVDRLIRDMRVKGVDEDGIRGFIAKFSGNRWEEFFEALFGYDEKIIARRLYGKGDRGKDRRRYAVWRDWIISAIDRRLEARKLERERALLAQIEKKAFEAKGLQGNAAARQANLAAGAVVTGAKNLKKQTDALRAAETIAARPAAASFTRLDWVDSEAPHASESLEGWERQGYLRRRFGGPLDILLGRRVRFLLAALILLGAAQWIRINGTEAVGKSFSQVTQTLAEAPTQIKEKLDTTIQQGAPPKADTPTTTTDESSVLRPLEIPGIPQFVCDAVGSWNGVLAGVLLLLSVIIYGHAMSVGVILGSAIILFGNRYALPIVGDVRSWMSAVAGGAPALLSMLFLRESED